MPLKLAPLLESELETFVRIQHAAFGTAESRMLYHSPISEASIAQEVAHRLKSWKKNRETARFLKVVDTDSKNETIACAHWSICSRERTPAELDEALQMDEWVPEQNVAASEAFFGMFKTSERELMGTKPHCVLKVLVTHPKHHRRGAGAMLVKWGVEKADELGLDCFLGASSIGRGLYERFGFKSVQEKVFDAAPYGGEGGDTITMMIRHPQKKEQVKEEGRD